MSRGRPGRRRGRGQRRRHRGHDGGRPRVLCAARRPGGLSAGGRRLLLRRWLREELRCGRGRRLVLTGGGRRLLVRGTGGLRSLLSVLLCPGGPPGRCGLDAALVGLGIAVLRHPAGLVAASRRTGRIGAGLEVPGAAAVRHGRAVPRRHGGRRRLSRRRRRCLRCLRCLRLRGLGQGRLGGCLLGGRRLLRSAARPRGRCLRCGLRKLLRKRLLWPRG